ncbi:molybdopterin-dependent oxidoreductase [Adlercreutzia sp. ZJ473]|uniref:molybdopterin-dependent oxidoreductase n=1 Tax=Adlercreutzia sp. ZJ473 TaxID=2722822 RepID=UPI0015549D52
MKLTKIPSTCQGCLANCPVTVRVEADGDVRVEGNPACAATHGATCPNVRIAEEQRRDPDRLLYPLRRTNPRKDRHEQPRFERITWDEALDEIADRLMALRTRGEGHRVAFAKGRSTGIANLLMKALPDIYGTPNRLDHDSICAEAEKLATGCLDGTWDYHDYDFERVEHVIMWGTDPLVGNRMKARFLRCAPDLRRRAHVTVVSPHRSLTAEYLLRRSEDAMGGEDEAGAKADAADVASATSVAVAADADGDTLHRWLPVIPGTDGALACAMAHVILTEGLWNRAYVGDFAPDAPTQRFEAGMRIDEDAFAEVSTHGLVTWWNEALKDATPAWAETRCGIGANVIHETARAFAAAGPRAISWISPGVTMCARGLYAGMACYALNGLVGSIGTEGGVLRFPSIPTSALPSTEPFQDEAAREANALPPVDHRHDQGLAAAKAGKLGSYPVINAVADGILDGEPYELDTLIAYWVNWAYSCTGAQRWEEALARVPFFVHVTTNLSETSMFADIVLPARHHLFEDWGFARSRMGGISCATLEQPSVEAPGECRGDETEFPFDLAVKLAEREFDAPLRYYRSVCDPCTGAAPQNGRELGEFAAKRMLRPLWDKDGSGAREAWEAFRACGVWNSEHVVGRSDSEPVEPLPTPSGRFEFVSEKLRSLLEEYARKHDLDFDEALSTLGYEARGTLALVPHAEPPVRLGDENAFPLVLTQHRSRLSLEGRAANTERFQRLKGTDPGDEAWDDVLKLHPDDLAKLGLTSGDAVRVTSVQGSITCRAKAWDGTRPGVAAKCYGQGHWAYGRVAAADFEHGIPRGGNNNELIPATYERVSSATARHGGLARIRVERA